jgi:glycosyltransferase involved in cell wall biosynthesis
VNENREMLRGLKILFVFGCLDLGGSERQGLHLARYLKATCDADVHVLALSSKPGRVSELCDEYGIPWQGMALHWSRLWPHRILELYRFLDRLKQLSADVLLPYYSLPNTICGLVWKKSSALACIWNQRDHGLLLTRDTWHKAAVRNISTFIANSECGKDFLQHTYGLSDERVQIIHNGISLPRPIADRQQWRDRLGLSSNDFAACMLANLGPYKDHQSLVLAWQIIAERAASTQQKAVLLLAGRGDDARTAGLKRLIDERGLADNVRLIGMVNDISGLLHASDIYIHSSLTEGSPNAILEAMAAGLPVVGTDIPGIREAVGPEGTAYLTQVGDYHGMAETIKTLMDDVALRNNYGMTLKARVETNFSMEQMCSASARVIATALSAAMNPTQ